MGWAKKQVNNVKSFVSNPGKSVNNLFKDVGNTVTNILKDPKALAVLAINIYAPGAGSAIGAAMGITNVTVATFIGNTVLNTALNGGDVNAAAKSAALQLGGQELASKVTAGLSDTAISTATKQLIGTTASNAAIAAIQGKDPMAAIAAGGIAAGVNVITDQFTGYKDLPVPAQNAVRITLTDALKGKKDITSDLVYGAIASGMQAYKNVSDGNAATKKELGRDLTDEEAKKLALYSSAGTVGTDIKNIVVNEKLPKAIESGQSSYTYDGKPVAVSGTDLNNYFKDKLTAAGLTPTTADISAAATAYGKSKNAADATNAVVDARSVDAQEVKDIFAKEGITNPTADIIAKYVKSNVDEANALADIQKQADAQYTTKQEVLDAFKGTGYTPTDEDITKFVGENPEDVQTNAVKSYADPLVTDLDESKSFLKSVLGRDPTDKEAALFVGSKPEADTLNNDNVYKTLVQEFQKAGGVEGSHGEISTDPGVKVAGDTDISALNLARISAMPEMLGKKGETAGPIRSEIAEWGEPVYQRTITGKGKDGKEYSYLAFYDPTQTGKNRYSYGFSQMADDEIIIVNTIDRPNFSTEDIVGIGGEKIADLLGAAGAAMKDQGYTPSIEDLLNIVNQTKDKSTASVTKAASDYGDKKAITKDEVKQYLIDNGISKPTDTQINQFLKKGNEADIKNEIDTYANPLVTTAAEAEQMLKDAGISKPTKEQIAMFTKEGAQTDTQTALSTYANPLVTTAQEVKDMFAKIGYTNPTQEEIDRYTGEKPEAVQLDMAKTYGAAALATKQYVDPLNKRIEELVKQGSDYQTASNKAIAELTAANKGLSETLGTGKKAVTQADIDLMTQMVSGKTAGDARYDVTGDKKVTQEDIDYLTKYLGAGTGADTFKPGMGTYWAPTGLYGELYGQQLSQEQAAAKAAEEKAAAAKAAAEEKAAAEKAAAAKAAADKLAYQKAAKQQAYTNSIMMNMAANAPTGNVSSIVQPPNVVEAAPIFSFEQPLDIGFFNQQADTKKDTQDQPGVVKIAQGGYMDMFHPQDAGGIDEILRILEGR